jgi:plasmid stabilization system protein ParE
VAAIRFDVEADLKFDDSVSVVAEDLIDPETGRTVAEMREDRMPAYRKGKVA